jgi:hypothetical protein
MTVQLKKREVFFFLKRPPFLGASTTFVPVSVSGIMSIISEDDALVHADEAT